MHHTLLDFGCNLWNKYSNSVPHMVEYKASAITLGSTNQWIHLLRSVQCYGSRSTTQNGIRSVRLIVLKHTKTSISTGEYPQQVEAFGINFNQVLFSDVNVWSPCSNSILTHLYSTVFSYFWENRGDWHLVTLSRLIDFLSLISEKRFFGQTQLMTEMLPSSWFES